MLKCKKHLQSNYQSSQITKAIYMYISNQFTKFYSFIYMYVYHLNFKAQDKRGYSNKFFSFFSMKTCCRYKNLLEAQWQGSGTSLSMLSWRKKGRKISIFFSWKKKKKKKKYLFGARVVFCNSMKHNSSPYSECMYVQSDHVLGHFVVTTCSG